ncbi:MAG TPA: alpha/beta hydrolase [Streptosporangiaceae bacterium]
MSRRKAITLGAGAAALAATTGVPAAAANDRAGAAGGPANAPLARSLPGGFRSGYAKVNGIRLHYVAGGQGEPLFLLPGWPETWWEYHEIMPSLAARYRVIVVELRGMGGSDKPQSGFDKKTMAGDIFQLVRAFGYDTVNIAGHDIGSMVAFSFAVNHPEATRKVALLDVAHPDQSYNQLRLLPQPGAPIYPWWFAFNQVHGLPEQLVSGRSRFLIDAIFDLLLLNKAAVSDGDRAIYAKAYSSPDAIRASNGWFQAFGQDIADLASYGKVTAPMLGLADPSFFAFFQQLLPAEGTDVRVVEVANSGHFIVEEQPQAVTQALTEFFG